MKNISFDFEFILFMAEMFCVVYRIVYTPLIMINTNTTPWTQDAERQEKYSGRRGETGQRKPSAQTVWDHFKLKMKTWIQILIYV